MVDWIKQGDTPTDTLVSFLRSNKVWGTAHSEVVETWASDLQGLSDTEIKTRYKNHWANYLEEYYGRGKNVAFPIYDNKKGWYTNKGKGNWQNAKIDPEHFYQYIQNQTKGNI